MKFYVEVLGTTEEIVSGAVMGTKVLIPSDAVVGVGINKIVKLSQAEYDALPTPSTTTMYVIL